MAFVGSIQQDLRSILAEMAPSWRGRPLYVGCMGNAVVERIASQAGVEEIHSCDVSLYSCALGGHLAGRDIAVTIKDPLYRWLEGSLQPGVPTIATLLLAMEYLKFVDKPLPYHQRMARAYRAQWADLHQRSVERVKRAVDGIAITRFVPGDVVDFVSEAPADAVVVSFAPTYKAGYERLYKKIDAVFGWDAPTYQIFDDVRFAQFLEEMRSKSSWVTLKDAPVPELKDHCIGVTQSGAHSKPVYVFAGDGRARVTTVRQKTDVVPWPRLTGKAEGEISLVKLSGGQLNTLRSEYLATGIIPAGAQLNLGVLVGGKLAGAMAFSRPTYSGWCDAYCMSDFCVAPSVHPRLSKLILAVELSTEVKAVLEQAFNHRIKSIGTTAFTKKPVSMKYRGTFSVHSRKPGVSINYMASAGRWSLREGFDWWLSNHGEVG